MRQGGEFDGLRFKKQQIRWPNLIVLCDISGSMSQYSRMVLHFLHAVANQRGGVGQVHAFTFGTRLTNISRHLANKDVDAALPPQEVRPKVGGRNALPPAFMISTVTGHVA